MATIATINGFADIVLDGEDPTKLAIPATGATVTNDAVAPPTAALPIQRPHFLTFEEQIDEQMIHEEVVNRDE